MKIIGTKQEVETLLSAIPGAPNNTSPIPADGFIATYQGIPLDIELTEERTSGWPPEPHVEMIEEGFGGITVPSIVLITFLLAATAVISLVVK